MDIVGASSPCPCGSGTAYGSCCGPLHRGERQARTAEALMRSRYSAYAVGDLDHVFRTWHPRTRPDDLVTTPGLSWTGLEIVDVQAGEEHDAEGFVVFRASFTTPDGPDTLSERSRFVRRAGRWVYLDGEVPAGS